MASTGVAMGAPAPSAHAFKPAPKAATACVEEVTRTDVDMGPSAPSATACAAPPKRLDDPSFVDPQVEALSGERKSAEEYEGAAFEALQKRKAKQAAKRSRGRGRGRGRGCSPAWVQAQSESEEGSALKKRPAQSESEEGPALKKRPAASGSQALPPFKVMAEKTWKIKG